jgi:molecular chaperone GrpE
MPDENAQNGRAAQEPEGKELPTARAEDGEPSGEGDATAEAEIEQATERAEDEEGEDPDDADGGEAESEPGEPEDPLARAERERGEYLALAQRAQADFENYRKRAAKEVAAAGERARGGLVRELLPVVDNLERALAAAEDGEQHLAEGVKLVHQDLVAVLERNGVQGFDPRGEQFDPELHEALSTRAEEGAGSGVVLDTVEKGYKLNGTVLRPARVVVSG